MQFIYCSFGTSARLEIWNTLVILTYGSVCPSLQVQGLIKRKRTKRARVLMTCHVMLSRILLPASLQVQYSYCTRTVSGPLDMVYKFKLSFRGFYKI